LKFKYKIKIWKGLCPLDPVRKMLIVSPLLTSPRGEAFNRAVSCLSNINLLKSALNRLTIILILSCACLCFSADSTTSKFRFNIGAGAAYVLSLEYVNNLGMTPRWTQFSGGSIIPSVDIGRAINPRFSLSLRYSHYLLYSNRTYDKFQQFSYIAAASTVVPSDKCSNIYMSYSLGYLQYWLPAKYDSLGLWPFGCGTTVACGYRLNSHFRMQIDLDCLYYSVNGSTAQTISPGDLSNTIKLLGEVVADWIDVVAGLSFYWDIF
jgi:hypothetical protein